MDREFEKLLGMKIKQYEWFRCCRDYPYFWYRLKYAHAWSDASEVTLD